MDMGLRILDTSFPVSKGGTFCSPGPFGAGKTVMQHHLSKYSAVDIVVIVACGESAGEVVEVLRTFPHLIDPHTNESLMNRTVMICNTSSMPVAAREASVYMGATIAEYYRQMGLDVLLLADSTSRWAQAMREMSGRLEEIPGEEAFPAYLALASPLSMKGPVLLSSKMENGISDDRRSCLSCGGEFRRTCDAGPLPLSAPFMVFLARAPMPGAIPRSIRLISWSKYIDDVGVSWKQRFTGWDLNGACRQPNILRKGDEIGKRMEVVGEEGVALDDMIFFLKAELYEFCYLQQNAFDKEDAYCPSIDRWSFSGDSTDF